MTLRVATFNIRNGRALDGRHSWPLRRRSTLAVVRRLDADVYALQEVYRFQRRWLMWRLTDYDASGVGRGRFGGGEQCPILVRSTRGSVVAGRTRWFGVDPDRRGQRQPGARFPRIATSCTVAVHGWAEPVDIVNVHLDAHSSRRRVDSVEQLASWLDHRRPQVVVGDLNAGPSAEPLKRLRAAGLRSVLPGDAPGTSHGFGRRPDGPRIDHILVNDRLRVASAQVDAHPTSRPLPSDHWPVVADLELVPTAAAVERSARST